MSTLQERLREAAEKFRGTTLYMRGDGLATMVAEAADALDAAEARVTLAENAAQSDRETSMRWQHRAEQAERELAEARAREQRLREALNDLELSDGAFRALVNAYLNPVSVTADDQKWAAEALRSIGGEAGGEERR